MHWSRWLVITLAALAAAWMVFDGLRALIVGDYLTPASGPHAGQLGPWAQVVSALGVDPHGTGMKTFFVFYGAAWLVAVKLFARGRPGAWWAMVAFAAGSLWYAAVGTVLALVQLALLVGLRTRLAEPGRRPVAGTG